MAKYEIIQREIVNKGKCYVICRDLEDNDFFEITNKICNEAYLLDADKIFYTCRDKRIDLDIEGFETDNFYFNYYAGMDILIKDIDKPKENTEIDLVGLSNENKFDYIKYHNEAFFDVPNSMTFDEDEVAIVLEDSSIEAGLLYIRDKVIGTYMLDFSEKIPEIASISINIDMQGKGYGKLALLTMENYIYYKGHNKAILKVSSKNENAYSLYKKYGYKFVERFSHWFLADYKVNKL